MFSFPSLLSIGLGLAALPVLIHLINLMRHQRVKWAAMDFLLQSQKRHKKWIVLKQLLLLLTRVGAIAAVALMVAQPVVRNEWGELFGGASTHHVVLLDDSFSMSDRDTTSSAFDRAKQVVQRLAEQAGRQGSGHAFSLLRYSGAARLAVGPQQDVVQQPINADFLVELQKLLEPMQPSETAATALDALAASRRLPAKSEDENRIVYLVSDFRRNEWNEPTELRDALAALDESNTKIHLVQCVDRMHENLAITELKPLEGIRAAGVELFIELAVKNFGDAPVREVSVRLEENGHSRPGLVIDAIGAGETVRRRFRVNFPTAGEHTIAARLGADAVLTDNTRFAVVDVPDGVPVLIVDGATPARDGYFLAAALNPGGKVQTGLLPQIEQPSFLRKREELAKFDTIYLANLERLDAPEIDAIEQYVRSGGGVAFFVGELSRKEFINEQLYRDGAGLFPVPLLLPTDLLPDRLEQAPDIQATDHPIFKTLLAMRLNPLDEVLVQRYYSTPQSWRPAEDSTVQVLAELRNGAPLVVERKFGDGRVVAFLTKASPQQTSLGTWNNWARNHSYLLVLLNLQGYLGEGRRPLDQRMVGTPLTIALDPEQYGPQVSFTPPGDGSQAEILVDATRRDEQLQAALGDTAERGIYAARLATRDGESVERRFAFNVSPAEGDLHTLDGEQLAPRLGGLRYQYHRAEDLNYDPHDIAGFNLSRTILYILLGILVCEQLLAYSASYHPSRKGGAR